MIRGPLASASISRSQVHRVVVARRRGPRCAAASPPSSLAELPCRPATPDPARSTLSCTAAAAGFLWVTCRAAAWNLAAQSDIYKRNCAFDARFNGVARVLRQLLPCPAYQYVPRCPGRYWYTCTVGAALSRYRIRAYVTVNTAGAHRCLLPRTPGEPPATLPRYQSGTPIDPICWS